MAVEAMSAEQSDLPHASLAAAGFSTSVFKSLEAAQPVWLELESRAVMTPYQRFDWIAAYCASGFEAPDTVAILVIRDGETPVALLPFGISTRFGVRIAQILGMPISNSDGLIYDPAYGERLTASVLRQAFGALAGVDIVSLHCLVPQWQGHANPLLALPHAPAPNNLYLGTLESSDSHFIDKALPHKRRTNIRRSERRLTENHGAISLHAAATVEDIEHIHSVFLSQRAKRFRQMGVENIFADAPFQALFRNLAIASLGQPAPAFRYHALYAGEEIVATSLGVATASHYSQYINSTTDGPASKYSLMGVMLSYLVDDLRTAGIVSFDMGLGDFDYKTDWTRATTVYDSVVPVSARGAFAAPMLLQARGFKRVIKQTPALWKLARGVLSLKTKLRSGGQ